MFDMTVNKKQKTPIITSLLDTDYYKLTMHQIIMHRFSDAIDTEFKFKCRNPGIDFSKIIDELNLEIDNLCRLRFTQQEKNWMRNTGDFHDDYLKRLDDFKLDRSKISAKINSDGELEVVARGYWFSITLFEIPVLSIINELYFKTMFPGHDMSEAKIRLDNKINKLKDLNDASFVFSDFGTRRRFSKNWQAHVVKELIVRASSNLVGTSNAKLAMELGIKPIGTMAHEYLQASQAVVDNLADSQWHALTQWAEEYHNNPKLMVALTDVIGVDAFIRDFDYGLANQYSGVRHDSGDPKVFAEKIISHYESLNINPLSKFITFSNSLDFDKSIKLHQEFNKRIRVGFGIGTNLTNDVGLEPLNIVMKMTRCKGKPVAKLSDDKGKTMCEDDQYIGKLKRAYKIKSVGDLKI